MARKLVTLLSGGFFWGSLILALPAFAQNYTGTSALTISANPAYPAPNSTVTLTAESPLIDLANSTIEWTVNGKPAGSGESTTIRLGSLGKESDVGVSVSGSSGSDSAQLVIVPTSIDLLWESNSYVPPFYKGRAVAGSGSSIRVLAIPHFVRTSGAAVPSSNIDFTWSVNGAVDRAQSGVGESSATFPAALLYGNDVIQVLAHTTDGSLSGEASVTVPTQDPDLVLYEDSPLFGIMYHQAIPQASAASESETAFAAVPYFANAASANDPALGYAWQVNGSSVQASAQDPSEITVNAQSSGTADISLDVSNSGDPFFSASGAWQISFNGSSAGGSNVFHTGSAQ